METIQRQPMDIGLGPTLPWMKPRPLPASYAGWRQALLVGTDLTILIAAGAIALRLTHVVPAAIVDRADVVMALAFTATIALLILECPSSRSEKEIGTSTTWKPARTTR